MQDQVTAIPLANMTVTTAIPLLERLYHVSRMWGEWAAEQGYDNVDMDAFGREAVGKLSSGRTEYFLLMVGEEIIGFLEATVSYDPAISQGVLFGERAYIVPEWRERGVYTKAFDAMEAWGKEEKAVRQAVVEVAVGSRMQAFYEARGFEVTDLKMRRIDEVH